MIGKVEYSVDEKVITADHCKLKKSIGFQVPAQHVKSNGKSQEQSPLSISQLGILKPVMLSWDKLCAAALAVRP